MTLRVRLLGGLEIEGVEQRDLGSRKQRTFLKALALARGAAVSPDALAGVVWGEALPSRPADQLAVLASRSRAVLGAELIVRNDAGYALRADWLDVAAAEELAEESARRLAAGRHSAARAAAMAGLALHRGALLPDEDEWCEAERAAAARCATRLRLLAAEAALAAGDGAAAAELSRNAVDADPYDEAALRLYLTACAASGRPAVALAAYDAARRRLDEDLGVRPAAATEQVYLAILDERVPMAQAPLAAALPGRAGALNALDAALASVRERSALVVVDGEAGIGKTRLLAAWAANAPATVLLARCDELGRDLPLQPVVDALVRAGGADDPALAPLLDGGAEASALSETAAQPALFAALLRAVVALGDGGPVVLALDDAHLADTSTLAWLAYARGRREPLLLVAARRVEEGADLRADVTVTLGPLDRAAAEEAFGERAGAVYDRSGGHPLFLAELTASDDGDLPASVREAVTRLVERAGAAAATLKAAAALGARVDLDLLAAVLGRPPAEVLDDLEEGVRRRLLAEEGAEFAFRHGLVREALAASLTQGRRALLHREAARALAMRPDADPMALAYHARLAGNVAVAASALADAAAVAAQRFDHATALALLDDALSLADEPALRRARGRVLLSLSRYDDAARDATAALAADPGADSLELAAHVAYYAARDFRRAAQLATQASEAAGGDAQRARCLAFAGRALHAEGDLRGADDLLTRAAAVPGGARRADVRVLTGGVRMHQGDVHAALELLGAGAAGDDPLRFAPVTAAMHRALVLAMLGRPVEAFAELDRTDAEAAVRHLTRYAGRTENCRGYLLRNLGAFAEADEWNERGSEGGRAVGQPEPQAHALLDLADGRLQRGDLDAAAALLDRAAAFAAVPHSYRWGHLLRLELLRGRLAAGARDADGAEEHGTRALVLAELHDRRRYAVLARLLVGQARLLRGDNADRAAIDRDLAALDGLAGMDAWRVTYDLADAAGDRRWYAAGDARVTALAVAGAPWAESLQAYAARRLNSKVTRGRNG